MTMSDRNRFTTPRRDRDGDCWIGVQDPRRRKQIQDRLAQRARRRRISERNEETDEHALQQPAPRKGVANYDAVETVGSKPPLCTSTTEPSTTDSESSTIPFSIPPSSSSIPPPFAPTNPCLVPQQNLSVYGAMFNNGRILGLTCGNQVPAKSRPATPDVPLTLQPTLLQLSTIHTPWLDRFPFPKMRDNAICMSSVMDEEEFLGDLFMMPSFDMVPGSVSWDPAGWRIGKEFGEKWGFLWS